MNQNTLHILLVESNPADAAAIQDIFAQSGIPAALIHASTLSEARRLRLDVQPDLIITEFLLPDGRGPELLPQHLADRSIPIIVITAQGNEQVAVDTIKAGALDYIVKTPESLQALPEIVEKAINEWQRIVNWRQKKEDAAWFSRILDKTLNEIYVFDAESYRFILVNQVGQGNLGYNLAELQEMAYPDICSDLTGTALAKLLSPLKVAEGERVQLTAVHQRRDTSSYPVELHFQLSQYHNTPVYIAIALDISQRLKQEEQMRQQDRLAAVGQLASGIAHDFNNIMGVIILYTQILQRSSHLTEKDQSRLNTIVEQASRAADLIDQILDFSRSAILEKQLVELAPFLKEHIKFMRRMLPDNILLNFQNHTSTCKINADATRLQQMLVNLMLNAKDAMKNGGSITLSLETVENIPGGTPKTAENSAIRWAHLCIADDGPGIPKEVQRHIFEPFFTTKQRDRGTGMGLAQVYGIVKQHEGFINVESTPGAGATFHIYLPLQPMANDAYNLLTESSELATGNQELILLVEDDAAIRTALVNSLELLRYQTVQTTNGLEALKQIEEKSAEISLIISDVVMPKMGGVALAKAVQNKGLPIPVILMTGHPLSTELEELAVNGYPVMVAQKPLSLGQLAELIAQALTAVK